MQVIVDPRLKYNYASWYLWGLLQLFNKKDIFFDTQPFLSLLHNDIKDYNSGFAFIVRDSYEEWRIFVDTEDVAMIFEDRYTWCDVYGMVNPTMEQVDKYKKLLPIGPQFGITLTTKYQTILTCCRLYAKGRKHTVVPFKFYLRDYLYTNIRRRNLSDYDQPVAVRDNYVFHASTLWYNDFAAKNTNKYRGDFLKACKKAGMNIEGGLFYVNGEDVLREMPDYPKYKEIYKDFIYDKRLSMDDYIRKTKESVVVFNTPSVCGCHGWKLAEYLYMGKAIISTPLTREMPGNGLVHGENVHFVKTEEDIYDAVVKMNTDEEYRRKLEQGARRYYEQWLAPEVAVQRLIQIAKEQHP